MMELLEAWEEPMTAEEKEEWIKEENRKRDAHTVWDTFDLDDVIAAHHSVEAGKRIGVTLVKVAGDV